MYKFDALSGNHASQGLYTKLRVEIRPILEQMYERVKDKITKETVKINSSFKILPEYLQLTCFLMLLAHVYK